MARRDLESAIVEIENRVRSQVKMPTGYFVELGGQFEAQRSATMLITVLAGVSVAGIFIVLMMLYPSPRITFQILNAIPTAFIGGVTQDAADGKASKFVGSDSGIGNIAGTVVGEIDGKPAQGTFKE